MKSTRSLAAFAAYLALLPVFARAVSAPALGWQLALPFPGTNATSGAFTGVSQQQMVTDARGNSYLVGYVGGAITLGGLSIPAPSTAGCYSARDDLGFGIVAKVSAGTGAVQWVSQTTVPCGNSMAFGVAINSAGSALYVHLAYGAAQASPSTGNCVGEGDNVRCYTKTPTLTVTTYTKGAAAVTSSLPLTGLTVGGLAIKLNANSGAPITSWSVKTGDMYVSTSTNALFASPNPNELNSGSTVNVAGPAVDGAGATVTYAQQKGPALVRVDATSGSAVFIWNATTIFDMTTSVLLAPWKSAYAWSPSGYTLGGISIDAAQRTFFDGTASFGIAQQAPQTPTVYTTPAPLGEMAFYGIVDATGALVTFAPAVVVENGFSWSSGDAALTTSAQSTAIDTLRGSLYAVGSLFGLRNCTAGTCVNTVRVPAANTAITLTATADPTYGTPSPTDGSFSGSYSEDNVMRQVFQAGFVYKVGAWALLITSTDFRWSGSCAGDLAFLNSQDGYQMSCFLPSQDVIFGGSKVFTVTLDPSDGGVIIVGHTIFNATYALPAGLTAGSVTFGAGASAITLPIAPVLGSYQDSMYPVNTGQSWVAKISQDGRPVWAKTIGPSKPDANGQAAPVVAASPAGFVYTGFATAPAAGRRLLEAAGIGAPVVAYFGDLPPTGGVLMAASQQLTGYNSSTFTASAQMSFVSGVAGVLNVTAAAVTITSVTDAAVRRSLLAAGNAVVVAFSVQASSASAASALATTLKSAAANGSLLTALQAVLPSLTAVTVASAGAQGASSAAPARLRGALAALALAAAALAM